jgi:F0F1-type ATP synthase assembly protein I
MHGHMKVKPASLRDYEITASKLRQNDIRIGLSDDIVSGIALGVDRGQLLAHQGGCNISSDFIKGWEFLGCVIDYLLLNKEFTSCM